MCLLPTVALCLWGGSFLPFPPTCKSVFSVDCTLTPGNAALAKLFVGLGLLAAVLAPDAIPSVGFGDVHRALLAILLRAALWA